jgi:tRNA(adenine34) deaminase
MRVNDESEHRRFMAEALDEARRAGEAGEVPIGALVVLDGVIVGRGGNGPIGRHDPTAHADRGAARRRGSATIVCPGARYVTVEPCMMCVGVGARAGGAPGVRGAQPKAGAVVSTQRALDIRR